MAKKSVRVSQPQENRKDSSKPFYKEVASVVMDERVHAVLLETETNITVFPHFIPGGLWTGRAWEEKKDDPGDGKGGKW